MKDILVILPTAPLGLDLASGHRAKRNGHVYLDRTEADLRATEIDDMILYLVHIGALAENEIPGPDQIKVRFSAERRVPAIIIDSTVEYEIENKNAAQCEN